MLAELFDLLREATLASSMVVVAVLALRRPVRRWLGAGSAYALWIAVPVALVAVLLPAPVETALIDIARTSGIAGPVAVASTPSAAPNSTQWTDLMIAVWLLGAVATAALLANRQKRFERRLGRLTHRVDGVWQAVEQSGAPVLFGLLRPRIVLPADFESRYDARQQLLVLAHERIHLRRGDLMVNAFAAAVRAVFWFNPLIHVAVARLRHDQELACDAAVLALFPEARRSYADAMLKTQLAGDGAPVGCHWLSTHPIKERIHMLKLPLPTRRRSLLGRLVVACVALLGGFAVWAAQPATPSGSASVAAIAQIEVDLTLTAADRQALALRILTDAGAPFEVERAPGETPWKVRATPTMHDGVIEFAADVSLGGEVIARPRWRMADGERATIGLGDSPAGRLSLKVHATSQAGGEVASSLGRAYDVGFVLSDDGVAIKYQRTVAPRYPLSALKERVKGHVLLKVKIDASGKVAQAEVAEATPVGYFEESVLVAVQNWTFEVPEGLPASWQAWVQVPFNFRLDESDAASPMPGTGGAPGA